MRMSIQEVWGKFKQGLSTDECLLVLIILTTALAGFVLGRHSVTTETHYLETTTPQEGQVTKAVDAVFKKVEEIPEKTVSIEQIEGAVGVYVASKSGTKYHLPTCAGAKQIKEENKIYFNTKEEAESAGYTPASNCKGI